MLATPTTADSETNDEQPIVIPPGARQGDHYLAEQPAEYLAYGKGGGWFGGTMIKVDWNADGVIDLATAEPGAGKLYIYDGSTQLKFPEISASGDDARWTASGGQNFGTDFCFGDVNGDGYDDLLATESAGYEGTKGSLWYGGPSMNTKTKLGTADATFICEPYGYYGSYCAIGDFDGDGYGDVVVGDGGYQYYYDYSKPGYSWWYYYYYGQCNWWYGSASMSGSYSYNNADGRLFPAYSFGYDYGSYGYSYHYSMMGSGGADTGDMNGDGRDELALGCPYYYYNNNYYVGAVMVMYPKSTIRNFDEGIALASTPHIDWAAYTGQNYFDSVGADPLIHDWNGDGYEDLIFNSGYYSYSSSYPDNGKWCWMIDGSSTIPTGEHRMGTSSSYSRRFYSDDTRGFGAHAFGDYDGDGLQDIALGAMSPGEVYVLLNSDYNTTGTGTTIEASSVSSLTIHAPAGASKFAAPVPYYRYYYYGYDCKFRSICFWERETDGMDNIFVSDNYATVNGQSQAGAIYGITNYDVFGIGSFKAEDGSLPDGKTYYAEYKEYRFQGSAWNRWTPYGTDRMVWKLKMGPYQATIEYSNPQALPNTGTIAVIDDPWGAVRVNESSLQLIVLPEDPDMLYVSFKVMFTLDLPIEADLDVDFTAYCKHMYLSQEIEDVGAIKNKFMFVG
ncbi:MAG: FG-GAP repeat domain-containing protein, partial [Thermoplasmatota archaeon]